MGLGGSREDLECPEGSWRVREGLGRSGRVLRVWDPDGLRVSRRVWKGSGGSMRVQKYGRAWECLGGSREVLRPEGVWEGLGRSGRVWEGPERSGRV